VIAGARRAWRWRLKEIRERKRVEEPPLPRRRRVQAVNPMLALQLERTGIPEVRRFLELAQFIQLHREVAGRMLSRQPGQSESAARLCAWVNQQLARRPRLAQDAGVELEWKRLAYAVAERSITVEESDERHAAVIDGCLRAAEAQAEDSGMVRDCAAAQ